MVMGNNEVLILDNFRSILSDFSVDVQDVVRSAILDGVDISRYINSCKNNPYKLDQIRLGKKQGISEVYFQLNSGSIIYKIRMLLQQGFDLSIVENHLKQSNLTEEYMQYLLKWIEDGINIENINILTISSTLLPTFDYGLRAGFDMSIFNNGTYYDPKYIKCCLQILKNKKSVSFLLSGDWSLDCLNILSKSSNLPIQSWNLLIENIDSSTDLSRLSMLIKLAGYKIPLKDFQKKESGKYLYSIECLQLVCEAYLNNLDYLKVIASGPSKSKMQECYDNLMLNKHKVISGRLRKNKVPTTKKSQ